MFHSIPEYFESAIILSNLKTIPEKNDLKQNVTLRYPLYSSCQLAMNSKHSNRIATLYLKFLSLCEKIIVIPSHGFTLYYSNGLHMNFSNLEA